MCRIFVNTSTNINAAMMELLLDRALIQNDGEGAYGQRDGWGFSNGDVLYKTAREYRYSNIFTIPELRLNKKLFSRSFIAHLRSASPNTEVTDKEAHPFRTAYYDVVHNGGFTPFTQIPGAPVSDTWHALQGINNLEDITPEAMEQWLSTFEEGSKFVLAFIEHETGIVHIVRGDAQRTFYLARFGNGFIGNTSDETLASVLAIAKNLGVEVGEIGAVPERTLLTIVPGESNLTAFAPLQYTLKSPQVKSARHFSWFRLFGGE